MYYTIFIPLGENRANSVCLTKNWVGIGAFPNATLTSKFLKKFVSGPKRSKPRRRTVWVGQADFSNLWCCVGGSIRGGGGVALERILFVLPKIGSKLELSLMRLLRVGKISQWTKKIKDAVGFLVGQADFSKIAQRKQKFIKHVNCVFT